MIIIIPNRCLKVGGKWEVINIIISISQQSSPLSLCNPLGLDQSDLNYRMTILAKRVLAARAAWHKVTATQAVGSILIPCPGGCRTDGGEG